MRKGYTTTSSRKRSENTWEKHQGKKKGGEGGAPEGALCARTEIPLQPMEIHGAKQRSSYTSGRPHARADGYLKEIHGKLALEQAAGRTSDPVEAMWALKQCEPEGLHPWSGPTLEKFVKNCSLREGSTLEGFIGDCLLWEGPHPGVLTLRSKVWQRQGVMNWPEHPFPIPLCYGGGGGREREIKLSLGRREWCFMIFFFPLLIHLWITWLSVKLISPSQACFACDNNWWVISLCPYLSMFSLYCPAEEGTDGAVWWAPDIQPGLTHNMESGLI